MASLSLVLRLPGAVTPSAANLPAGAAVAGFPRVITDGAGRTVVIPQRPARVVSLSPALTEAVLAEGGLAQLVGVTRYCVVPERTPPVARVGGIVDPDYEAIIALRPDLVLLPNLADRQVLDRLESAGLRAIVTYPEGLDNLPRDLRLLGNALGEDTAGENAAKKFEATRALVQSRVSTISAEKRPSAILLYPPGLLAPGPGSFAGQLLTEAGAHNLAPSGAAWTELSTEALLKLDPAMIFLVREAPADTWPPVGQSALQSLTAVRAKRVVDLPNALFIRPGPSLGAALWTLAQALYPATFPESTAEAPLAATKTAGPTPMTSQPSSAPADAGAAAKEVAQPKAP